MRFLSFMTLTCFLFFSAATAAPKTSETPRIKKILNMRIQDPPITLDWTGLVSLIEAPILINICNGLYSIDYDTKKAIPEIAESVTKSKDLTEYTFTIRKNAKWSDGRQIYAQDFVDAWTRVISPQSTSIYSYYLFEIKNAVEFNSGKVSNLDDVGLKAVSDRVLKVKLKRPNQNWEYNTSFWPLFPIRKDQVEKFGANWWRAGVLISSGAFIFDSNEQGKEIVLRRNPYYVPSGKKALTNVDEVHIYIVGDNKEALEKYETGFFPFLSALPIATMSTSEKRKDYHSIPIARHNALAINSDKYPMNNREFRLAVLEAIDATKLIPPGAVNLRIAKSLIPPPLLGSRHENYVKFNPASAREHLKKSGVVTDKNFQLRLVTIISEPFLSIGRAIQKQLNENLKMNVDLATFQNQEYTTYMNLGDYHASFLTWTAKVLNSQDFLLPYSGLAAHSRVKVPGPFYDQWILEGVQAANPTEAEKDFDEAQKVITNTEGMLNPLFFETSGYLQHDNVSQLEFNQMALPVLKNVILK
jgi:oligopeptide transport system substrate-binding protein